MLPIETTLYTASANDELFGRPVPYFSAKLPQIQVSVILPSGATNNNRPMMFHIKQLTSIDIMPLNQYIWNNYKQTIQGKETISLFIEGNSNKILSTFAKNLFISYQEASDIVEELYNFCTDPVFPEDFDIAVAAGLFQQIATSGITLTYEDAEVELLDPKSTDFLEHIPILSTWLYLEDPNIFKPYFFQHRFDQLTKIADAFELTLPTVPLKRYKQQRFYYYFQLCEVFLAFQKENQLTAPEFCAFLYDFAPNYLEQTVEKEIPLPQPTQVWWIGGNKSGGDFEFLDNATPADITFWQGNEDTKRGDILVMYCLSPRSYIHSIWRATADGINDPFFHYYSSIYIGHGQRIAPISIHELKADPHFSQNPLVKKNLQGINGYPLTSEDYQRLQALIQAKDGDLTTLTQLYSHVYEPNKTITNESGVEEFLINPLLEKIGYTSDNWVRQLSVRMGRGERNYPDYAFLIDRTKGYEKAEMLIESKFFIRNNRELEETFRQVWSYGQRLGASKLIIADKDALWIYERKQDAFDRSRYTKLFWKELDQPDNLNRLKKLVGKR